MYTNIIKKRITINLTP